jgi:formylglycine-generating enzyme required for sulfatase activity
MPGRIFISYRRDDVADAAARLADGLAARFRRANVFMDVDHLLPGERFDQKLAEALSDCDVLVAVVGRRWMELLQERSVGPAPDYVRQEIAEALRRGIVVIPVLVGLASQMPALPDRHDLPEDLRDLVLHQKHEVAHERFGRDLAELIAAIMEVRRRRRPARPPLPWRWIGAAAAGLAVATGAAIHVAAPRPDPVEGPPTAAMEPPGAKPELAPKQAEAPRKAAEEAAKREADADARAREAERLAPLRRQAEDRKQTEARRKAEAICASVQAIHSVAELKELAGQHKGTPAETCIAARIEMQAAFSPLSAAAARALKPGDNFKECDVCPEMVVVPAGEFMMGSPAVEEGRSDDESQHRVTITQPFAVGKFEVTGAEWMACWRAKSCTSLGRSGDRKEPVVGVSSADIAFEYLPWLNGKIGRKYAYRLPTEAEWEYAARAGTTTPFWWGASLSGRPGRGKYSWTGATMAEVDSYAPNPWGLYNVHGNALEWVQDRYDPNYDATGGSDYRRVLRGGSQDTLETFLRSASRFKAAPDTRLHDAGFRVVRKLDH